jgi:predicted lipoprotein with Yx(FWY)xxD motif
MTRSKPITFLASAAVIPLTALAVAACGGGGSATAKAPAPKTTSTSPPKTAVAPPKATTAHGATVSVANTGLGKVLVDSQGRTLYLFKGASGMKSAPTSAFAAWPPLQPSGKPTAGGGAKASLAGTSKDAGGQTQVTYNGDPLYTFVKDQKPGDTTGEGVTAFGGTWLVVSPAGNAISGKPASSSGTKGTATPAAPTPTPKPKPAPAPRPAAPPAPKKPASSNNGIPQNNGGDHDSDNNGGPSDGDGGI